MTTITVPINKELESFIKSELESGRSETKAHVVRYALRRLAQERAFEGLLESLQEVKDGKVLRGDLRELAKKLKQ